MKRMAVRLVARVEDLEHADARAVVDGRELVEALPAARNALEELHIHLQAMPRLRLLVALPAPPSRPMLLIGRQPAQAMLAEEAMHGRAGDRDLMEPPQIVGDPAGAEVILLAQIQDLADDLRRRGARRPVRRRGAIAQPRLAVGPVPLLPLVVGLARDAEVAAGLRHGPVLAAACCRIFDRQVTSLTCSAFVIASPLRARLRREKRA